MLYTFIFLYSLSRSGSLTAALTLNGTKWIGVVAFVPSLVAESQLDEQEEM
jgi:hypothetical protein